MDGYRYRCEASSLDGFVSQLIRYVSSGHYFYITGRIPERKDVHSVDEKLIKLYGIAKPRWARARRRLGDQAGIHYLRHERFFVLTTTKGKHRFFEDHRSTFQDIRRQALHVGGYAIRYTYSEEEKRWKVFVRLDRETYQNLRASMLDRAVRPSFASPDKLEQEFGRLRWQPYAPVRRQLVAVLRAVNRKRRYAGFPRIRIDCLPRMRRLGNAVSIAREPKNSDVTKDATALRT